MFLNIKTRFLNNKKPFINAFYNYNYEITHKVMKQVSRQAFVITTSDTDFFPNAFTDTLSGKCAFKVINKDATTPQTLYLLTLPCEILMTVFDC